MLALRDLEGRPDDEIARVLGTEEPAVPGLVGTARLRLHAELRLPPRDRCCAGRLPELSAYADGTLAAEGRDELERTSTGCANCRAALFALREAALRYRALPVPEPPGDLGSRIGAALGASACPARSPRQPSPVAGRWPPDGGGRGDGRARARGRRRHDRRPATATTKIGASPPPAPRPSSPQRGRDAGAAAAPARVAPCLVAVAASGGEASPAAPPGSTTRAQARAARASLAPARRPADARGSPGGQVVRARGRRARVRPRARRGTVPLPRRIRSRCRDKRQSRSTSCRPTRRPRLHRRPRRRHLIRPRRPRRLRPSRPRARRIGQARIARGRRHHGSKESSCVRPLQMVVDQAQEGRCRRQARQALLEALARHHRGRQGGRARPRLQHLARQRRRARARRVDAQGQHRARDRARRRSRRQQRGLRRRHLRRLRRSGAA